MRLLSVFPSTEYGGNERYALTIARAALARGWEAALAFPERPSTSAIAADCAASGIRYCPLEIEEDPAHDGPLPVLKRLTRTVRLLRRLRPDLVHFCLPWPNWGFASVLACALLNVPAVVVFQLAPQPVEIGGKRRKLYAWARRRRQHWVAVSDNNRANLCQTFAVGPQDVKRIYNGAVRPAAVKARGAAEVAAARQSVRAELGLPAGTRLLTTVGRLSTQKGYADLLSIVPQVVAEDPDVAFVWVGSGPLHQELAARVRESQLGGRVFLLGQRDDVPRLLAASDLFVFPTHFEGQPFALIEAMSCGLPIVSSDASGIPELLADGRDAVLYPSGNVAALLDRLRWALAHRQEMAALGQRAQSRAEDFTEEQMIEETLELFQQAVGGTAPAPACPVAPA